jgi:DNA helicase II / ATP-dependent DNA helicase PcrA
MDVLQDLNPAQQEAVQTIQGPVLVLAGPGSGKTRVLTHRIAYLIQVCGVPAYRILAVTFTNKAAREMIMRLQSLIGESTSQLTMGTFHAICVRILRRDGQPVGVGSNLVIYDADDQRRLITKVIKELNLDPKMYRPNAVHGVISRAKNELYTAQTYQPPTYWHEAVARVFERYDELKAESNALDFDDLLLKAVQLFAEHADVLARYQQRYQFILVDEFQDTNRAQYEMIRLLAGEQRNVFVVGDEDQSIYSWRGADYRNVRRFYEDYPEAKIYLLEQNYRSTRTILDAAHAVIAHNEQRTDKKLWTRNKAGQTVRLIEAYDEGEEAEYVVGEIQRLVARGETTLSECAVMFRTNAQSRALEESLNRHHVPYKLVGAMRFYQRREIKDVLSYLAILHNPDDSISLYRVINVPSRGIGPRTLEELELYAGSLGLSPGRALLHLAETEAPGSSKQDYSSDLSTRSAHLLLSFGKLLASLRRAYEQQPLSELLQLVLDKTGYLDDLRDGTEEGENRINNVRELFTAIGNGDALARITLPAFLEQAALVSDVDETDWNTDAVTLLTLHSAKGLEFDTVFIVGLEEGICPHSRSMEDPDGMEEERRLCYVGITRAKRHLYLLRTFRRSLYGSDELREPSRFLLDIPPNLVDGNLVRRPTDSHGAQNNRRATSWAQEGTKQRRSGAAGAERTGLGQRARQQARTSREGRRQRRASYAGEEPIDAAQDAPHLALAAAKAACEYTPGESVIHPIFGPGIVVDSKLVGDDEEVTVAFEGLGVKRLMASFANLEKAPR